jgi:hypothetical protein
MKKYIRLGADGATENVSKSYDYSQRASTVAGQIYKFTLTDPTQEWFLMITATDHTNCVVTRK